MADTDFILSEKCWKKVHISSDYEVSNKGDVRRCTDGPTNAKRGRILSQSTTRNGHKHVYLRIDGKTKTAQVHRLVAKVFVNGETKEKNIVCHKDGNAGNNCAENLYWGTPKSNADDCTMHGNRWSGDRLSRAIKNGCQRGDNHYTRRNPEKILRGEQKKNNKLTAFQVLEIRRLFKSGFIKSQLARDFGVTFMAITKIVRRETWSHI